MKIGISFLKNSILSLKKKSQSSICREVETNLDNEKLSKHKKNKKKIKTLIQIRKTDLLFSQQPGINRILYPYYKK